MLRLKQRWQFLRVASAGQKFVTPSLIVQAFQNEEDNKRQVLRVGYTVSKKVGNAVTRNRVKRWIREAVRHHHHCVDSQVDVVFIASPRTARSNYQRIEREIATALETIAAQDQ